MKKVLILGSGMVSRPGVKYLLNEKKFFISVASNEMEKAQELVAGHNNAKAFQIDVNDANALSKAIQESDLTVSLLPYKYHPVVAKHCLKFRKHMVTTSYVSQDMKSFDDEAKRNDLIFLNEVGVDPGIDHMSAKKIIDSAQSRNETILHFYSYCGGLPAPKFNNNPIGYKFSWSPRGVLLAAKNSAKFFENGRIREIPNSELFKNFEIDNVTGMGDFEVYPNRDSTQYKDLYGLSRALTIKRGTYRNPGWCVMMDSILSLGLLDDTQSEFFVNNNYKGVIQKHFGLKSPDNINHFLVNKLNKNHINQITEKLNWLGLFSEKPTKNSATLLDMLCELMQEKMMYGPGESDMIIMKHKFIISTADDKKKEIISTLIDFGIPGGDTSMSRTVSLPMAVSVKLILEDKIKLRGVQIPIFPEIYNPVLSELKNQNIEFKETTKFL